MKCHLGVKYASRVKCAAARGGFISFHIEASRRRREIFNNFPKKIIPHSVVYRIFHYNLSVSFLFLDFNQILSSSNSQAKNGSTLLRSVKAECFYQ